MEDVTRVFQRIHEQRRLNIMESFNNKESMLSVTDLIKAGVLEYDDSIEKAVYADTYENRKLGRVGQEYHRGKGEKKEDENNTKNGKMDYDTAVNFLEENADWWSTYQYDTFDEDDEEQKEMKEKFDAAKKFIKKFKMFEIGSREDEEEAKRYKEDMESKGYKLIDFGQGSGIVDYAILKDKKIKKSELGDIEKSDIMDAISYDSEFKFKKSGKEIKEQIKNVILPIKRAELKTKKNEANSLLTQCGEAPKNDVCRWWLNNLDLECGYKTYRWEECREMRDDCGEVAISVDCGDNTKMECNCAKDENEAKARREYNECVEIICRIMVDIKACELLDNNLKDTDEFKMNVRQIAAFKFA